MYLITVIVGGILSANPSYDGKGERFWNDYSVIVAQVANVQNVAPNRYQIELVNLYCLTSWADPALYHRVIATFGTSLTTSAINVVPKQSQLLIVLLSKNREGTIRIPSGSVRFFPSKSAFVPVVDFNDKAIHEIRENLIKLRNQEFRH